MNIQSSNNWNVNKDELLYRLTEKVGYIISLFLLILTKKFKQIMQLLIPKRHLIMSKSCLEEHSFEFGDFPFSLKRLDLKAIKYRPEIPKYIRIVKK